MYLRYISDDCHLIPDDHRCAARFSLRDNHQSENLVIVAAASLGRSNDFPVGSYARVYQIDAGGRKEGQSKGEQEGFGEGKSINQFEREAHLRMGLDTLMKLR